MPSSGQTLALAEPEARLYNQLAEILSLVLTKLDTELGLAQPQLVLGKNQLF